MEQTKPSVERGDSRRSPERSRKIILLIAAFKLVKAILLIAVAIGALKLLDKDVAEQVSQWIAKLRVDPDNHYIHGLISKLTPLDDRKLEEISVGSFIYAGLFLVEGIGLLLGKRWAEYFTAILTGSFIPLEMYELVKGFNIGKAAALVINVLVVVYLAIRLKKTRSERADHHKADDTGEGFTKEPAAE